MTARTLLLLFCLCVAAQTAAARDIYVAKTGDDEKGRGTRSKPYLTISKAARVAGPGDTVIVHGGTYREWVKPFFGGRSDRERIVYRAADGEEVIIKGSEQVTGWVAEGDGVWKVELPKEFFGDYNPFALTISGEWLTYGANEYHRGDVYIDGEDLNEQLKQEDVREKKHAWFAKVEEKTTIWANFGDADPNKSLTEVNVRESVFMPEKTGLGYITVDGFHLAHSAENWQPPGLKTQMGAIGPRGGKRWVIENCTITNARCAGIILGHAEGTNYDDIDAYGDHVVRNNVIRRCGEAGMTGQKGATRSLIEGNFIEDTNYRKEFGGWETAGIKFHQSIDTVISGNLIRGVYHQKDGAFGIWMDWGNQGTRITGNIIYNTSTAAIYLEMNHGAQLVDNNVLIGGGIHNFGSEGIVYAHNLFVDCGKSAANEMKRQSEYCVPHTKKQAGRRHGIVQDELWYSNVFIRIGLDKVGQTQGYKSDCNVFLEGAKKSTWGDEHSIEDPFVTEFRREDKPGGVTLTFKVNKAPGEGRAPMVDSRLVGVFSTINQTLEDRHGKKIKVDEDMFGVKRKKKMAGPLAEMDEGQVAITWPPEKKK